MNDAASRYFAFSISDPPDSHPLDESQVHDRLCSALGSDACLLKMREFTLDSVPATHKPESRDPADDPITIAYADRLAEQRKGAHWNDLVGLVIFVAFICALIGVAFHR